MPRVYRSSVKVTTRKAPWKAPILILYNTLCMLLLRMLLLRRLNMMLLRSIDILGLRRLLRLISLVKLSIIPLVILIPLLILITRMKSRLLLIHMRLISLVLIMRVVLVLCRVHRLGWTCLWRRSPAVSTWASLKPRTLARPRPSTACCACFSLLALLVGTCLLYRSLSDISAQKSKNI